MMLNKSLPLLLLLSADVNVSAFQASSPHSPRVLASKASVACAYCAQLKRRRISNDIFQLRNSQSENSSSGDLDDVNGTHFSKLQREQSAPEVSKGVLKEVPRSGSKASSSSATDSLLNKFPKKILDGIKDTFASIFNKKFGSRGEIYVIGQLLITYSIAIGHVPLLKNFFEAMFGPILFILGAGVMAHSIREMGSAFTAYATPVSKRSGGRLVVSGLYEYVRHPIYAGNIACLTAISIMTGNAMRLLLTAVYWGLVEMKTRKEEQEMVEKFGLEYNEYCKRVPHKFFPLSLKNQTKEVPTHKWKMLDEPKKAKTSSIGSSSSSSSSSSSAPIPTATSTGTSNSQEDDGKDDKIKGKSSHSNLFP